MAMPSHIPRAFCEAVYKELHVQPPAACTAEESGRFFCSPGITQMAAVTHRHGAPARCPKRKLLLIGRGLVLLHVAQHSTLRGPRAAGSAPGAPLVFQLPGPEPPTAASKLTWRLMGEICLQLLWCILPMCR
jgi:hypothetical protein